MQRKPAPQFADGERGEDGQAQHHHDAHALGRAQKREDRNRRVEDRIQARTRTERRPEREDRDRSVERDRLTIRCQSPRACDRRGSLQTATTPNAPSTIERNPGKSTA